MSSCELFLQPDRFRSSKYLHFACPSLTPVQVAEQNGADDDNQQEDAQIDHYYANLHLWTVLVSRKVQRGTVWHCCVDLSRTVRILA